MGREPNLVVTRQVTISTTPQVVDHLDDLVRSGLWGTNRAGAAERLVTDQIKRLIQDGTLRRPAKKR